MKQIPNILTTIRLLLLPVYWRTFYSSSPNALRNAMIIYVVASLTDILDGYIARTYDAQSSFGAVFDPLADKLLQLSVLYTLSDAGYISKWFFYLFLGKEIIQIIVGVLLYGKRDRIVIPANQFGKITSILIFVTIIVAALDLPFRSLLEVAVAVFAVLTLLQYGGIVVKQLN